MYKKNRHIHFIGIGGIGMSGIATILKQQGYTISGCDEDVSTETIAQLKAAGCNIYHHNNATACNDLSIDIVVYIPMYEYTIPAITKEIERARARNIITATRAQMLAELMRTKYSIAVTGSHGKTTTSALIAHVLCKAGLDPSFAIGGHLKNNNSNAHIGTGNFFVAEADESDRSFLSLNPTLNVITNIDIEHLETYKDLDDIKQTYAQFIKNVPFYGKTVACVDDKNTRELIGELSVNALTYGIDYTADVMAHTIQLSSESSTFAVQNNNNLLPLGIITLPIPGLHNVYNALAAITVAVELGIHFSVIQKSLSCFKGVDRRFSYHGTYKGAEIFDDYGHHPKEIEHMLSVARNRTKNKVIIVFQPHRYTRTQKLWNDFITIFNTQHIDTLIITDIYSAGEAPVEDITSKLLVEALKTSNPRLNAHYIPFEDNFTQLKDKITKSVDLGDLILLLGAGKMHLLAPILKNTPKTSI